MNINPNSIIPSTEVLVRCRAGLTKHIRKTKAELTQFRDKDIRKVYYDKLHKLKVIRDEIQYLIDHL